MTTDALLISSKETALRLGICDRKCRQLIYRGELESVQIGTRRLVPVKALEEYVNRLRAEA